MRAVAVGALALVASAATANQMFDAAPTSYIIAGKDIDERDAYSISVELDRSTGNARVHSLSVTVYGNSLSIDTAMLRQLIDPHLDRITVTNDAGVNGHFIYIDIPFGPLASCRTAKKQGLSKSLLITNLGKANTGSLEAHFYDPCARP